MDLNTIEIEKTGLLFFDVLNGYYHEASNAAKQKKKPMIDNAVRLMKSARKAGIPIFLPREVIGKTKARPSCSKPTPTFP
jgi:nicotinamidase-related amidase